MAPIEVKTRKGKQTMQVDEHARPQTTLEQLQKLPPVFKKEGTVTAGNASVGVTRDELAPFLMCSLQHDHDVS
jgi:acetyl-CoA acetyltransferase